MRAEGYRITAVLCADVAFQEFVKGALCVRDHPRRFDEVGAVMWK
jgi:hypothetical protein